MMCREFALLSRAMAGVASMAAAINSQEKFSLALVIRSLH
jgi:hypothetical protein